MVKIGGQVLARLFCFLRELGRIVWSRFFAIEYAAGDIAMAGGSAECDCGGQQHCGAVYGVSLLQCDEPHGRLDGLCGGVTAIIALGFCSWRSIWRWLGLIRIGMRCAWCWRWRCWAGCWGSYLIISIRRAFLWGIRAACSWVCLRDDDFAAGSATIALVFGGDGDVLPCRCWTPRWRWRGGM